MKSGVTTTRLVQPDDQEFLYRVFVSSREEEFALLNWAPERVEKLMREQFDLQTKGYAAAFPHARHLIVLFNGEPVGRAVINENDTEIRMVDVAILTPFRRWGIGGTIVRDLQELAAKVQKPLRHRVYHGELAATRFYFALGYRVIGNEGACYHMEWTPLSVGAGA